MTDADEPAWIDPWSVAPIRWDVPHEICDCRHASTAHRMDLKQQVCTTCAPGACQQWTPTTLRYRGTTYRDEPL